MSEAHIQPFKVEWLDGHPRSSSAVAPNQIWHVALEQGGEAVVNHAAITDILGPRPPKPVLEWATWDSASVTMFEPAAQEGEER